MVTSFASIWYQSLGWWWRWFNVSRNFFLTRMSHHLVEPFDSMNYHWFGQRNFSNWAEQDLSYNRWCHQHRHLVVSWLSCLNYLGRSVKTTHIQESYFVSTHEKTPILLWRPNGQIVFYFKSPMTFVFVVPSLLFYVLFSDILLPVLYFILNHG